MSEFPFVSVIIPTYQREQVLRKTVMEVLKQDYPNFEIIISDQTANHTEEVKSFLDRLEEQGRIKHILLDTPSITRSKNAAISIAKGEIVLILDDDVLIPSNMFIHNHVKMYKDNSIAGTAGKIVDRLSVQGGHKTKDILKNICGFLYGIVTDPTGSKYKDYKINHKFIGKLLPTGAMIVNQNIDGVAYVEVFAGANTSFRKDVLEQVGLFDKEFRGNAHREESDLSVRIIRSGYKIIYTSEAEVFHLVSPHGGSRNKIGLEWYNDYFFNNAFFFYKHFHWALTPFLFLHLLLEIAKAFKEFRLAALRGFIYSIKEGYMKAKEKRQNTKF